MTTFGKPIALGRTAQVFAWQDDQVLKLFHDWVPENWVTHEFRVAQLVQATGMDVPAVIGEIIEVNGRRGICYQRLDGDSMMQHVTANPFDLLNQTRLLGKLHAEIHTRQGLGLPSQREKLKYKISNAESLPDHLKEAALNALEHLPDGDRVCHGDFHPGNILMTARGPVIIDWTDASCGDPLSDVARTLVMLKAAHLPLNSLFGWLFKLFHKRMLIVYTHSYFKFSHLDQSKLKEWMPVIAAARMNEKIPEEDTRLLEIVRKGLS